jgi:hypothetical protein
MGLVPGRWMEGGKRTRRSRTNLTTRVGRAGRTPGWVSRKKIETQE